MTTEENAGADSVAVLYDRFTQDVFTLQASLRCDRMISPAYPEDCGPNAKECWALFENYLATYRWAFNRLNESIKLHRELTQQPQVAKLIFRTRAKQGRQPFIADAKACVEKARLLYMRWLEDLAPVDGRRTVKAYLAKVDRCQALWLEYGFSNDEIERLPTLLDSLKNEWALIEVDREPSYKAKLATQPDEQQPKVADAEKPTKKAGRKPKTWTPLEKDVHKLKEKGKTPLEIRDSLISRYHQLTKRQVDKTINALSKRIKRGNGPK